MADQVVQVAPDSTGKKVQTFENTVNALVVQAQAVVPVSSAGAPIDTATAAPAGTERGLVVRPIPSGTQAVSGPLTDAQLRATAVPVADGGGSLTVDGTVGISGTVPVSGPLTDAQLRATAVPVSGPLTDAQLRASAVPISAAALPLPTGAATDRTTAIAPMAVRLADGAAFAGRKPTFIVQSTFQTIAQNAKGLDIWNGHASAVIRVLAILLQKNMAAVTGLAQQYDLNRYTSAPAAGTALTPVALESSDSLPAGITCGRGRTITLGSLLLSRFFHSEESNVAAQVQEAFPFWPPAALPELGLVAKDLVLRPSEGIAITEITAAPVGTWNVVALFTTE